MGAASIDIAITGANGAVGKALIERLGRGSAVKPTRARALVRDLGRAGSLRGLAAELVEVNYDDPESLERALEGAQCVAHLAGSLRPRAGDSLLQSNLLATRSVVEASLARGVDSFVYLSFPGADPGSKNEYLRAKGQAEELIREHFRRGAIFRVPMILGPDAPAMNQLKKLLRSPTAPLIAGGAVRIQPIYEGDVLGAVEWALLHPEAPLRPVNLVGPDALLYAELLRRAGEKLGKRPRILPIPRGPARACLSVLALFSPAFATARDVFDIIFYEHLREDDEAWSAMSIPRTGVDEALSLSLPNPE